MIALKAVFVLWLVLNLFAAYVEVVAIKKAERPYSKFVQAGVVVAGMVTDPFMRLLFLSAMLGYILK